LLEGKNNGIAPMIDWSLQCHETKIKLYFRVLSQVFHDSDGKLPDTPLDVEVPSMASLRRERWEDALWVVTGRRLPSGAMP
jgi:hypothetical protein